MTIHPRDAEIIADLIEHADWMARRMEDPKFTYTRNGVRLAIAAIRDETNELWDEWNLYKRTFHADNVVRDNDIAHELRDIAAIVILMLRNVPRDHGC